MGSWTCLQAKAISINMRNYFTLIFLRSCLLCRLDLYLRSDEISSLLFHGRMQFSKWGSWIPSFLNIVFWAMTKRPNGHRQCFICNMTKCWTSSWGAFCTNLYSLWEDGFPWIFRKEHIISRKIRITNFILRQWLPSSWLFSDSSVINTEEIYLLRNVEKESTFICQSLKTCCPKWNIFK